MKKANGDIICDRCGEYIGNMNLGNYFANLPRKYCSKCRPKAKNEQNKMSARKRRFERKEERRYEEDRAMLLKRENELQREYIRELEQKLDAIR